MIRPRESGKELHEFTALAFLKTVEIVNPEALNCEAALRPGRTVGDVFDTHVRVLTRAGYKGHFLNACGYTLGATYPPTWMDEPMIYADNSQVLAPGMVFFIHMILLNSRTGLRAPGTSQTVAQ